MCFFRFCNLCFWLFNLVFQGLFAASSHSCHIFFILCFSYLLCRIFRFLSLNAVHYLRLNQRHPVWFSGLRWQHAPDDKRRQADVSLLSFPVLLMLLELLVSSVFSTFFRFFLLMLIDPASQNQGNKLDKYLWWQCFIPVYTHTFISKIRLVTTEQFFRSIPAFI